LDLGNRHTTVLLAPAVKGRLGNAVFAADSTDSLLAALGLLQDLDDLLGRKLIGLH
jgi:hypothetical protein